MCCAQRTNGQDEPIDVTSWQNTIERIAGLGQRLLAIGFKALPSQQSQIGFKDVETGLTLLGLIGMIDPPRPEAMLAVQTCQNAGIRVKMITGDHAATAAAIAAQLNIGNGSVLSGAELDRMTESELKRAVRDVDVFARSSPENKLRLVAALHANGHVVAMTGDGVNDAPALKCADVGVAMGKKGTEVAKEASEMVLADDNFASIAYAVEEGRGIYDNLKKSIIFILPTGFGEAFVIVSAIFMGEALPITPVQILWVNMITTVLLSLTLAFEPPERNIMIRKPRKPQEPLLTGFLTWRIVFVSLIMVTGSMGLFLWERSLGTSIEEARTVAVNTLVFYQIFYIFNSRYLYHSVLNLQGLFGNLLIWLAIIALILFQFAFTHWQPMQTVFGTTDLSLQTWQKVAVVSASVFFLVEFEKFIIRLFLPKSKIKNRKTV